ncbi:hypothetical protein MFFDBJGM_00747 [Pectobacterium versatile]|uniref:Uncharacterized protein n=1 Tax=Pectobacterium versatile TaxID=2488639 RepID=A0A855MCN8_9GAMM|nr:hypothetical protein OA04_06350 [Pectobacterium versatile]MCL6338770.1 hypothetical protein [Pectobacterium carotovorum subsp. carotovorum]ULS45382.1 hypothetical protein F9W95_07115 [Pectobacterium carotovorum]AZK61432.1 hypothetical protein EIP93_03445 [Pectobacterium versatile]MCL6343277.1 hypothetical protein [Pectobacterium carotovorum subsp. carotovorum]
MTGKKKLGQKRVVLLTSAQVSPAIGGNVLLVHYTILNLCGNAPVWLCDFGHDISIKPVERSVMIYRPQ